MNGAPELCYLDAVQARTRFADRSLSPVELVSSLVARIEAVEPKVNALTYTFFDGALDEAREAERRYAGRGARPRPLEGLPVVIKDFHNVKGEVTTYGSRLHEHHRPARSLVYVDRLLRAGAILLARTTTPEFALLGVTHSVLWGVTRNPWNLALSPGGSSGGAGAALAAGMTTLADGSDIGGSIRIPASCCGVFGLKPSHGRVPSGGPGSLDSYLAYGPMVRTVADAALMLNIMAGRHRDDPASVPDELALPLHPEGIEGCRIAFSMDPWVLRGRSRGRAQHRVGCRGASRGGGDRRGSPHPMDPPRVRGRSRSLRRFPGLSGPRDDATRGPGTSLLAGTRVPGVHAGNAQARARGGRGRAALHVPGHGRCLRTVPRPHHANDRGAVGSRRSPRRRCDARDQRQGRRPGLGLVPHVPVQHARAPSERKRPERLLLVWCPDRSANCRGSVQRGGGATNRRSTRACSSLARRSRATARHCLSGRAMARSRVADDGEEVHRSRRGAAVRPREMGRRAIEALERHQVGQSRDVGPLPTTIDVCRGSAVPYGECSLAAMRCMHMTRLIVPTLLCLLLVVPAAAQETTNAEGLRAFLADVRDWPPTYDDMTRDMAKRTKRMRGNLRKFFSRMGALETIAFWETYRGVDLYLVSFTDGRAVMQFQRDGDGKVARARVQPVAP